VKKDTKDMYAVLLNDGTEYRGEYVGVGGGFIYLFHRDAIVKIDQQQIAIVGIKQVPADPPPAGDDDA
jgi:hypothetical protein